ncbi:MAG: ribosomal protein S19 family protein [Nanoarchaeota archaeon]|nr:ribosomal protein S19 family protein [Nanoarchaeota archaeon]
MEEQEFHKKEFIFRGKTLEELQKLDTREFAKFLKSTQRRAILRQTEIIEMFLQKCQKRIEKSKNILTHNRSIVIVPKLVGLTVQVYSGKQYVPVKIEQEMLGHRLGEFVPTRTKVQHGAPGIGATKSSAAMSVK